MDTIYRCTLNTVYNSIYFQLNKALLFRMFTELLVLDIYLQVKQFKTKNGI